jgi:hypothetical protein
MASVDSLDWSNNIKQEQSDACVSVNSAIVWSDDLATSGLMLFCSMPVRFTSNHMARYFSGCSSPCKTLLLLHFFVIFMSDLASSCVLDSCTSLKVFDGSYNILLEVLIITLLTSPKYTMYPLHYN